VGPPAAPWGAAVMNTKLSRLRYQRDGRELNDVRQWTCSGRWGVIVIGEGWGTLGDSVGDSGGLWGTL